MIAKNLLLDRITNFELELKKLKQDLQADDDYGIYSYLRKHYEDLKLDESLEFAQVLSIKLLTYLNQRFPFIRTFFNPGTGEIILYLGHWFRAEELGRINVVHLSVQLNQEVVNYLEKYETNVDVFKMNITALEEQADLENHYNIKISMANEELRQLEERSQHLQQIPNERTIFGKPKNVELENQILEIQEKIRIQKKEIEKLEDQYKLEKVNNNNRIVFKELLTIEDLKLQDFVTSMGYNEIHKQFDTVEKFVYELLSITEGTYLTYLENINQQQTDVATVADPYLVDTVMSSEERTDDTDFAIETPVK